MSILVIPKDATEEELEAQAKALKPPEETKPRTPRGWEVYWKNREPKVPYDPPPPITVEEMKAFRESKGWFQKHLAIRTGYSPATIKHMESGGYEIPPMLSSMIHLLREVDELRAENERLKASQEPS
jgi:DNA-binding XRE family transcriptional regulator